MAPELPETDHANARPLGSWIGREQRTVEVADPARLARAAATLDLAGDAWLPMPHWFHFTPDTPTGLLGADGHPLRGGFLPPVELPRRMFAGADIAFLAAWPMGAEIERTSRIADIRETSGSSGALTFVEVDHVYRAGGRVLVRERQTLVYRPAGGAAAVATPVATDAELLETVVPSTALLFRFSAVTFNSHRIHYDQRYATEVEGYPDLVVHGPLLAALLAGAAARRHGSAPSRFAFRAVAPAFVGLPIQLRARPADGEIHRFEAGTPEGRLLMKAEARFGPGAGEGGEGGG